MVGSICSDCPKILMLSAIAKRPFEGPTIEKPPALPEDRYFLLAIA